MKSLPLSAKKKHWWAAGILCLGIGSGLIFVVQSGQLAAVGGGVLIVSSGPNFLPEGLRSSGRKLGGE